MFIISKKNSKKILIIVLFTLTALTVAWLCNIFYPDPEPKSSGSGFTLKYSRHQNIDFVFINCGNINPAIIFIGKNNNQPPFDFIFPETHPLQYSQEGFQCSGKSECSPNERYSLSYEYKDGETSPTFIIDYFPQKYSISFSENMTSISINNNQFDLKHSPQILLIEDGIIQNFDGNSFLEKYNMSIYHCFQNPSEFLLEGGW
jgi:hypothetical protein